MGSHAIELEGRRLEVLDLEGDPSLPPIVLLHEGLGSVGLWRDFPHALAERCGTRVVAFSRYGHGASDPPPRPRAPRFIHEEGLQVLPAVEAALGIDEPMLVGHSDGASIALIHAASHRVRGVVAMAPHVFVEPNSLAEIRAIKKLYEEDGLRERMARYHRDPDAAFYGWNDVWLDPAFQEWSIEDLLPGIRCPLLLIQGVHDQYGTMAQLDRIEAAVPGAVRRLPLECRHIPHLEAREDTLAATTDFFRGLAASR